MKFIFIRHGETEYNKVGRRQGSEVDLSLNKKGVKQIKGVAESLAGNFDVIISSPLKRALESAQIIARRFGKEVIVDYNIRERSYGSLSGKTWEEIEREAIGNVSRIHSRNQTYDYRPYGGESIDDVKKRFLKFIEGAKKKYVGKTVLVVSHGGIIRAAHYLFFSRELSSLVNASLHEFDL